MLEVLEPRFVLLLSVAPVRGSQPTSVFAPLVRQLCRQQLEPERLLCVSRYGSHSSRTHRDLQICTCYIPSHGGLSSSLTLTDLRTLSKSFWLKMYISHIPIKLLVAFLEALNFNWSIFQAQPIINGSFSHPLLYGPLHTRAKSRDHKIVRAQKKSVQRPSQHTSKIMSCGHRPSSVV